VTRAEEALSRPLIEQTLVLRMVEEEARGGRDMSSVHNAVGFQMFLSLQIPQILSRGCDLSLWSPHRAYGICSLLAGSNLSDRGQRVEVPGFPNLPDTMHLWSLSFLHPQVFRCAQEYSQRRKPVRWLRSCKGIPPLLRFLESAKVFRPGSKIGKSM